MEDRRAACIHRAMAQLALEFNTTTDAFSIPGLTLTLPAKPAGVRLYSRDLPLFAMATTGNSVVVTADARLHDCIRDLVAQMDAPYRLFEFQSLQKIDAELRPFGYTVWGPEPMYLRLEHAHAPGLPKAFAYRWFETEAEIAALYPNTRYTMALSQAYNADRPDVLALAAYDGAQIAGIAGASADTADMWQIGIDVLDAYRGHGLATALVHALCCRIEEKGKLPFYGTAVGNLHSQKVALRCGFSPAWLEAGAVKLEG